MTGKKIEWFKKISNLNEIYQSVNIKFSFAGINKSKKIHQCHDWVKCRDYLHDIVRTSLTGNKSQIYGMTFDKKKNPEICLDKILMLVSQNKIKSAYSFRSKLNNALKLINHYENMKGLELSKIEKVSSDTVNGFKHVWLLTGPKFWLSAPYLVSLYTFFIRLGDKTVKNRKNKNINEYFEHVLKIAEKNNFKGDEPENDITYLKDMKKVLDKLIISSDKLTLVKKNGFSKFYYAEMSISNFHNNCGILSLCKKTTCFQNLNKNVHKILGEKNDKKVNAN